MKKLFLAVCALCLALSVQAQKVVTDNIHGTKADVVEKKRQDNIKGKVKPSGAGIEYVALKEGFGLNYNAVVKHVLVDFSFGFGKTESPIIGNFSYNIGLGGNYRHWIGNVFYVEGRAGVAYYHSKIEMTEKTYLRTDTTPSGMRIDKYDYSTKVLKNGDFGLFVSPRIGVKLFNGLAISAGYRWNFLDFKFKEGYISDYFSVGVTILY